MYALDAQLLADASRLWPDAPLAASSVLGHLARRLDGAEPAARLDLVFAALVLGGYAPALTQFEALVRTEARRALGPIDQAPAFVDEVAQLVLERLLVSTPTSHARLADYAGQGPLSAWLRAVTTRVALNARRLIAREDVVSQVPDGPLAAPDPELAALRRRHQLQFRNAFEHAVKALTARELKVPGSRQESMLHQRFGSWRLRVRRARRADSPAWLPARQAAYSTSGEARGVPPVHPDTESTVKNCRTNVPGLGVDRTARPSQSLFSTPATSASSTGDVRAA